ncbi:MAG: tape measure protein [Faecalibacterium sp.]|jgi:tape measure domain-containing protein|nr:tape measure protein [Faecalibacterium sp.]
MAADFSIRGDTKLDPSGITTGIIGIKKRLAGLGHAFIAAGTAGISAFAAAATAGVTYNAQMEQYTTSFEVMAGSQEKAAQLMIDLKEKAAKTPFELSDLTSVTQLLMNYGFTCDEVVDKMAMLGDISQGDSAKLNAVALAYGQMSSYGKVTLQDVKQMIGAGFNPLQEICESTGESMDSLYDRISKGTMTVDEITAAMERSTSAGGKYYQSMDKQSQTLNGRLSTLKDTISGKLGEAFTLLTDIIRDKALPAAIEFVESFDIQEAINNVKSIVQSIEKIAPALLIATAAMAGFKAGAILTALIKGFQEARLAVTLFSMGQTQAQIASAALDGTLAAHEVLVGLLTGKITLAALAQKAWNAVMMANPIGIVIAVIAALVAAFIYLWNTCEPFKQFWLDLWQGIQDAFAAVVDFLGGCVDAIVAFFTETIPSAITAVGEWFSGLLQSLSDFFTVQIPAFIQSAIDWFLQLPTNIAFAIGQIIGYIILFGVNLISFVTTTIPEWFNSMVAWFAQLPGAIWDWLCAAISNITAFGAQLISNAVAAGSAFVSNIISFFAQLPGNVASWLTNTISNVGQFAANLASKAVQAASGFCTNIQNGLAALPGQMLTIGSNIVSGIWNGIKAGWTWLTDSVKNLANSLLDGVKSVLGIHSPSKKFAWIGKMSAVGMEEGFENEDPMGTIKESLSKQMGNLKSKFSINAQNSPAGNTTQNIDNSEHYTFNEPVKTPSETARTIHRQRTSGLAGARA